MWPLLVSELARARHDHGHVVGVRGGDDFFIADGATWLDDGGDPHLGGFLDPVRERKETVRGQDTAGGVMAVLRRLVGREERGVDSTGQPAG